MTCSTCANKRVDRTLKVLALCTPVMTGMTPEERAAYKPDTPCKWYKPE